MTLEEAITWTNATAVFSKFGRDAPWGIYTQNEQDAILYMNTLQLGRPLDGPEASSGGYPHYHYGIMNENFIDTSIFTRGMEK